MIVFTESSTRTGHGLGSRTGSKEVSGRGASGRAHGEYGYEIRRAEYFTAHHARWDDTIHAPSTLAHIYRMASKKQVPELNATS